MMMMSKSFPAQQETMLMQKQGILTILSSDLERNRGISYSSSSSLRRTLSADMSSKKWLSQNGFSSSPIKKTASSEKLSHSETVIPAAESSDSSFSSEGESDEYEAESIWRSIQNDKKIEKERYDIWSSILSQKTKDEDATKSSLPPPYVHPMVKRSQSLMSEKSLEICTESLGSETGSEGFSSYPSSDAEEDNKEEQQESSEKETEQQACVETEEDFAVPKYNHSSGTITTTNTKKVRSFPPPIPSLARQDGPSIHMRSHRDKGRLVLEAVSVPSQNNFCAKRQDGRLLLTFNNHQQSSHDDDDDEGGDYDVVEEEEIEEVFDGFEEEDHEEEDDEETEEIEEEEEKIEESEIEIEKEVPLLVSSGIINSVHHKLALTMKNNKPIRFVNSNPKWSEKLNEVVHFEDTTKVVEKPASLAKSLPPRPRTARSAASGSFNLYEYYWKTKSTNHQTHHNPMSALKKNTDTYYSKFIVSGEFNQTPSEQQKLLVLREKNGDYSVHNLKSCKESRRSLLMWEPQCIATS